MFQYYAIIAHSSIMPSLHIPVLCHHCTFQYYAIITCFMFSSLITFSCFLFLLHILLFSSHMFKFSAFIAYFSFLILCLVVFWSCCIFNFLLQLCFEVTASHSIFKFFAVQVFTFHFSLFITCSSFQLLLHFQF